MPRVDIRLQVEGLRELIDDLEAFSDGRADLRATIALDQALAEAEEISRGLAHVHQGDLKSSIESSSEFVDGDWHGEVGSKSRGAYWEIQRGGDHSAFIDGLTEATSEAFEGAIDSWFSYLR